MTPPRYIVLSDRDAVCREAADRFIESARSALDSRGVFRVALAGGNTPAHVYPLLRTPPRVDQVEWDRVEWFWGDERAVPPDDAESNFGATYRMFISRLPDVRPESVHRMEAEREDLDEAARDYEGEIREAFGIGPDAVPVFDLIWLGLGPDGHTASIFPGSKARRETRRLVVPNYVPAREMWRMTLTYPVLNAAREVLFLVTGENKANAVRHIRRGNSPLPAARVTGRRVVWLLDAAAAGQASTGASGARTAWP